MRVEEFYSVVTLKTNHIIVFMFFVCLFTISYLAVATPDEILSLASSWDKANHFMAFSVLYFLLSLSFKNLTLKSKLFLLLLYGFHIEIVQYFIPNREFSLFDVVADFMGIAFGHTLFLMYNKSVKLLKLNNIESNIQVS